MKPESEAMCDALLAHHRNVCPSGRENFRDCTIGYRQLCTEAGVEFLYRRPGPFLLEVAEWCVANEWPPINALAINEGEGQPGGEYDVAPGCAIVNWPAEAAAVVAFRQYPHSVATSRGG